MKRLLHVLPLLFIYALISCGQEKKNLLTYEEAENAAPLVLYTSLDDTLPGKAVRALNLHERVLGVKVKYMTGVEARYFEYQADADDVLRMISELPFSVYAERADTVCLKMNRKHLELIKKTTSPTEIENASSFWTAGDDVEIYACNKYPYMHTVLIDRKTNKVQHRVFKV